jgi:hypothetical protein
MKAILKFNLPEESHEFANAIHGAKMKSILWDLKEYYRSRLKYEELSDIQFKTLEECSEHFWNLINSENIDIDS